MLTACISTCSALVQRQVMLVGRDKLFLRRWKEGSGVIAVRFHFQLLPGSLLLNTW